MNNIKKSIHWKPQGKRNMRRPISTWRRELDTDYMVRTLKIATNRQAWHELVEVMFQLGMKR